MRTNILPDLSHKVAIKSNNMQRMTVLKKNLGEYQIPNIPCGKTAYKLKYGGDKIKNGVFFKNPFRTTSL